MRVVPFSDDQAAEWDACVARSRDAWLFHLAAWKDIEEQRARSVSFYVEIDGGIAAICPLYVSRRTFAGAFHVNVLHTGIARSGPALVDGLGRRARAGVIAEMLRHADALARHEDAWRLEIRLPPLAPANLPPLRPHVSPLAYWGEFSPVKYGRSSESGVVPDQIVDLRKPEDALWAELDDDCRKAIRKARKSGLVVTRAAAREEVAVYHQLHRQTYGRTGAGILPLDHFLALWDLFAARGSLHLLFAEHESRPVAGMIVLAFGDAAMYWAGSSDAAAQALRPNNLLMWEAMQLARARGCAWFELGPTFPAADPQSKARRIGRFKEQFGGEPFELFEGAKAYRPTAIGALELVDRMADRIRSRFHRRSTT